uniref:Cation/H+ exchanger protein 1 n=1 Tax=Sphaeramia orbicularis TaxID=375764 RepID=A0A673A2M3_9TELE
MFYLVFPCGNCSYTCALLYPGGHGVSPRSMASWYGDEGWHEATTKTTIRAENEVEAHREANNYKFGFRKWKGNVTERPIEGRSEIIKELYSDLSTVKHQEGSLITVGNVAYVFLFGWWISLFYFLICPVMFLTVLGAVYGKLCWKMGCYFIWPFGKSIEKAGEVVRRPVAKPPRCEVIPEERDTDDTKDDQHFKTKCITKCLKIKSTCEVTEYLICVSWPIKSVKWLFIYFITKIWCVFISCSLLQTLMCEAKVILYCNQAVNWYYYKYAVQGINIFALNLLPLVLASLVIGYTDKDHNYFSSETKFATAITSIIPLSYFIGMGIASISAQSNFAVGAVVNATFGSITEITFYITALLQGQRAVTKCYEEIVKAALTGTLLGCILFIPGICMIIGGIKHREQRFNSRSAGVSSALLFISIGGVFAPTLFSKAFGNLVCDSCTNIPGNASVSFTCKDCHYDMVGSIKPLVYTISVLLSGAYLIGLIFTLKTHSHIYDIHISDGHGGDHVVHWSRWRALAVLIVATALMACCADLSTDNIEPMLTHSAISQYFIGVTLIAMVPELPEIVNGIQFALQNNISLSLEVGSCIAVQVCMIQIPVLIVFNAFYDVGFVLVFSDIHLWASIFSVILVNYIFMDGKCDYFQGTALVVVYLILLALYFFAPSPRSCW